jgi:Na+/melibiose symporter-like transporter
MICSGVTFL